MRWEAAPAYRRAEIDQEGLMATLEEPVAIDGAKLEAFVFRAVDEIGATLNAALVVMGDKLGLYRALAGAGPLTPEELATRTGTAERYVREWLNNQAAGGYVEYDPATGRYTLPPEQAMALTDETSPAYIPGFFQIAIGSVLDSPRITEAVRTGEGVGWHDHVHDVHEGCERFFRPGYNANLISSWLPALDGVVEKLESGAKVADVGCGHGASTILMAQAFPNSTFVGSDYHDGSIETARARAEEAGVADRVTFEVSPAAGYSGEGYDLVTMFDCLHDMGDPAGAARHVRSTLAGRRHVDDRRAGRGRPRRGQPQPRRARVLRLLDAALHARLAVAGGRARARRTGGRGAHPRRRHDRRAHPLPPCGGDAVQPRLRGTAVATTLERNVLAPDDEGFVEREGVRVHWERWGDGERTILFLPTWSIIHSRSWKAQVPWFSRRYRVLTFDPRGNGLSDRPADPAAYAEAEYAADALAVLDATGTDRAAIVGHSRGAHRGLLLAADHPERVTRRSSSARRCRSPKAGAALDVRGGPRERRGLGEVQRPLLAPRLPRLPRVLLRRDVYSEPHSTKQIEDFLDWSLDVGPEGLIASQLGTAHPGSRGAARGLQPRALSDARDPRRRGRDHPGLGRRGVRRGDRGAARSACRAPGHGPQAAPRSRSTS